MDSWSSYYPPPYRMNRAANLRMEANKRKYDTSRDSSPEYIRNLENKQRRVQSSMFNKMIPNNPPPMSWSEKRENFFNELIAKTELSAPKSVQKPIEDSKVEPVDKRTFAPRLLEEHLRSESPTEPSRNVLKFVEATDLLPPLAGSVDQKLTYPPKVTCTDFSCQKAQEKPQLKESGISPEKPKLIDSGILTQKTRLKESGISPDRPRTASKPVQSNVSEPEKPLAGNRISRFLEDITKKLMGPSTSSQTAQNAAEKPGPTVLVLQASPDTIPQAVQDAVCEIAKKPLPSGSHAVLDRKSQNPVAQTAKASNSQPESTAVSKSMLDSLEKIEYERKLQAIQRLEKLVSDKKLQLAETRRKLRLSIEEEIQYNQKLEAILSKIKEIRKSGALNAFKL